jgi:putative phage-type endonuclease
MSQIVQLTQGSAQWLAHRRTLRNASETPAVLGISPWVTPYQLWLQKTGRAEQPANAAMLRGTELEPLARHAYEVETAQVMQPLVLQDGAYGASLDGMTLGGELIMEIKCPMRGQDSMLWRSVASSEVPSHYMAQIQHQLMVSKAALAHLWVFDGQVGLLRVIEPQAGLIEQIRHAWDAFQIYLDSDTPPPLVDADTLRRDDETWCSAAEAYLKTKLAAQASDEALDQAKQALVALAAHPREQGAGVAVTRFWKVGSVDYKKVPELSGVNLDAYRSKAREEVRVTVG